MSGAMHVALGLACLLEFELTLESMQPQNCTNKVSSNLLAALENLR